jgi:hypothetical protein
MSEPSNILMDFVAGLIEAEGGVTDRIEPDGLEYLAPAALATTLGLPAEGRLGFGPELPEGARRTSLEAELLDRLGRAIGERGAATRRTVYLPPPPMTDPERVLHHALSLQNAVFRFVGTRSVWTRYLVLLFRYTAVSDEKRDGLLRLAVNLATGSTIDAGADAMTRAAFELDELPASQQPEEARMPALWSSARMRALLERGLPERIEQRIAPFLASIRRRHERDLERLFGYYTDLQGEAASRANKPGADVERERLRIEAIGREYGAKVADLEQKYAVTIQAECVQSLDLRIPVYRFDVLIKRRKGERRIALDWNPLLREMEPIGCEYSYTKEPGRMVCDDALHVVSLAAHGPCAGCGKPYCRACHPAKCPKCGHAPASASSR